MSGLNEILRINSNLFHPIIQFDPANEKIILFDFTEKNIGLQNVNIDDTEIFSKYINDLLQSANAKFGFGGYNELRILYSRSQIFNGSPSENNNDEPRRLHLGIDIWGNAGTEIFAPLDGIVHSFAFNNNFGDYGATIILKHELENESFHTLYGHLSLDDIKNLNNGEVICRGQKFAHFGHSKENGSWPPHLHFQLIQNIESYKGDYPGVCKSSERKKYLSNCSDPDMILQLGCFISNN